MNQNDRFQSLKLKSSKKLLDANRIPIINYISENQKKNNQQIISQKTSPI